MIDGSDDMNPDDYPSLFNLLNCPFCGKEIDLDSADEEDGVCTCPHCDKQVKI